MEGTKMVTGIERAARRGTMGLTFVISLVGIFLLGWSLFTGESFLGGTSFEGWNVAGWKLDGLTTFFLFVLLIGQGLSSLYGMSYMKEYEGKKSLVSFSVSWLAFLGSMAGVLLVTDGFYFLLLWEMMSLFSFFLVLYEHEEREHRKAAFIYLVMTHVGTVFLTSAVLYLYAKSGSFAFSTWASFAPELSLWERNLIFLCLLIGLGTKAGLVPFHIWLPYAHPVAPTPVSALMSGVMVKVALYLMLRLVWLTLNPIETWWGWLLLILGVLSAFVGILYASVQQDVKRLLAYSTVENVGILAMALGAAMLAKAEGFSGLAQLALMAFFWHTLQHLLFKSTLFMVAGNIIQAAHTRRLEQLGGLLKRLPKTGFWALWGAMGLAALPPLGGFWGEWLLFHALWETSRKSGEGIFKLLLPIAIAILGLVSALALATMIKWFASAFLGQARTHAANSARELPKRQTGALGGAIALGVLTVLWPTGVFRVLSLPIQTLTVTNPTDLQNTSSVLAEVQKLTVFSDFFISARSYGILLLLITGLMYFLTRGTRRRVSSTWNCGAPLTPRMQYSSLGITMPLRILFKSLIGSRPMIEKEYGENRYILRNLRYQSRIREVYEDVFYRPSTRLLLWCAERIRMVQTGSIHFYLAYMLVTLVIVLIWSL
jgi:hydrogenase-4 component B